MHDMVKGVTRPIVRREFRHEKSPWGIVMNNMRAKRHGEHVVQLFANGATGWLVWEVSPSLSYRLVRGNVLHQRGDHRVKVRSLGCGYWRSWPSRLLFLSGLGRGVYFGSMPVRGIIEWPPMLLWA